MYVSTEIITAIVSVFSTVALLFSGMFALLRRFENRIDKRFDQIDRRFVTSEKRTDEKFAASDRRADEKFAAVHEEIGTLRAEVRAIAVDVVDLKVAVARIEGSRPRLIQAH